MSRKQIIDKAVSTINRLPMDKIEEVADFADYILQKIENNSLQNDMEHVMSESTTFDFLCKEDDIYTLADLKERYK